ncbi:hypothetical protein [Flavobacterium collinsii]|uniref:Uncharacterized protein n=1 Tax=Flavobacterium collinsii TaxID=1114861 RepID=A0ABN7EEV0_9FLAO|nr:hypothetical protein [Flavobacterium collinsii]CAA9195060.1 hypothetical protein FLACOL7796_00419 [Flavobacterium collinsii]
MEQSTWKHGFKQRTGLDTDSDRVKEIIKENYEPKNNRVDKAIRLSESVTGRDSIMVLTKKELIDLIFKGGEDAERQIKKILVKNDGKLNGFVSHIRQELK